MTTRVGHSKMSSRIVPGRQPEMIRVNEPLETCRHCFENTVFMPSGVLMAMRDVPVFRILNSARKEAQKAQNFKSFVLLVPFCGC